MAGGREQRASTLMSEAELKVGAVEQTAETAPSAGPFPQADQVKDKVDQASPLLSRSPNQTLVCDELERGGAHPPVSALPRKELMPGSRWKQPAVPLLALAE